MGRTHETLAVYRLAERVRRLVDLAERVRIRNEDSLTVRQDRILTVRYDRLASACQDAQRQIVALLDV